MQMKIERIDIQHDRILLYGKDNDYHVIAPTDKSFSIGDVIEYEPYGYNFGWLICR